MCRPDAPAPLAPLEGPALLTVTGAIGVTNVDGAAVFDRDPACNSYLEPFLYFKGFQALQAYRVAHWLWENGRKALALYLQIIQQRQADLGDHPDSIDTLASLAQLYLQLQNVARAEQTLQQAEQLAQQFPGHSHRRLEQARLAMAQY